MDLRGKGAEPLQILGHHLEKFEDIHLVESIDLLPWKVSKDLFQSACSGEPRSIAPVSIRLIKAFAQRRAKIESGDTQSVGRGESIPDHVLHYAIFAMVAGCTYNYKPVPHDLVALMGYANGCFSGAIDKGADVEFNRSVLAGLLGETLVRTRTIMGVRKAANKTGISKSTVSDYLSRTDFKQSVIDEANFQIGVKAGDPASFSLDDWDEYESKKPKG